MTTPITIERAIGDVTINLRAIPMGSDLAVVLSGGDRPHIGAVALCQPRPSLSDDSKTSTTTSVLTLLGHKEDSTAKRTGERIARNINATVTVACGIHIDDITTEQLLQIDDLINDVTEELVELLMTKEHLPHNR